MKELIIKGEDHKRFRDTLKIRLIKNNFCFFVSVEGFSQEFIIPVDDVFRFLLYETRYFKE